MNEQTAEFFIQVLDTLKEASSNIGWGNFNYKTEIDQHKEYISIELLFEKGNAKFSDVVLFYYNSDFNPTEFIEELEICIENGVKFTT